MNVSQLYERAYNFLKAAKFNYDNGYYDISIYATEEALYLFLNACIIERWNELTWYFDFDALLRATSRLLSIDELDRIRVTEKNLIKTLNEIRIRLGYSIPLESNKKEAEELMLFAERIFEIINKVKKGIT
ncbi:DNA-binding protein [Sulfolobus sp. B1]|uniref:HEPN domain-containing protein n=1 Tax=Sulfolobus sp. B1 TaxID=2200888 RepID=UPI00117C2FCB|nr:HEPN domain-containing protein [Sulfolobus sp. B1]TRM97079.1 DNA-binding protein [Sulfolobus sp. B1]